MPKIWQSQRVSLIPQKEDVLPIQAQVMESSTPHWIAQAQAGLMEVEVAMVESKVMRSKLKLSARERWRRPIPLQIQKAMQDTKVVAELEVKQDQGWVEQVEA